MISMFQLFVHLRKFNRIVWLSLTLSFCAHTHTRRKWYKLEWMNVCVFVLHTKSTIIGYWRCRRALLSHNNCLNHWILRIHISNRFDWTEYFMEILRQESRSIVAEHSTCPCSYRHCLSTCVNVSHCNYAILTHCHVSHSQKSKKKRKWTIEQTKWLFVPSLFIAAR